MTSFGVSSLVALSLFGRWEGRIEAGTTYPMPGVDALSFSSPRAAAYEQAAQASAEKVLPAHAAGLAPREGEEVIIAEADPQGRQVATKMRGSLYRLLEEVLGQDAVVLRTIAGDVTSNGTVAERSFVPAEAAASGDVPTVAVKGDHDSPETVDQLRGAGAQVPDLEILTVGGLRVTGASDPASKAVGGVERRRRRGDLDGHPLGRRPP